MGGPQVLLFLEIAMTVQSVANPRPTVSPGPISTGPLSAELLEVTGQWSHSQHRIVALAAEFAESAEWVLAGSPSPAHWLAAVAGVEACTAREWVRIGRQLRALPATADAFATGRLSYSKVRTLTRIATADNESELVQIALHTSAGDLGRVLAAWLTRTSSADALDRHHHRQRSVRWRNDPDGMVTFTLRLPPLTAALLIAWLTRWVMTSRTPGPNRRVGASADASTVAQQHADAIKALVTTAAPPSTLPADPRPGAGHSPARTETEVVIHVRADGCSFDDGTPISDTIVNAIAPTAFLRALIHDAQGRPINASGRQRHPSTRQKRVVKERDQVCRDCGRNQLLEYDHVPAYDTTGHTLIDELQLRCAPCHARRHST
ncbi:MAG: DUF222 domain-containing protein [Aquihabitans sp.]